MCLVLSPLLHAATFKQFYYIANSIMDLIFLFLASYISDFCFLYGLLMLYRNTSLSVKENADPYCNTEIRLRVKFPNLSFCHFISIMVYLYRTYEQHVISTHFTRKVISILCESLTCMIHFWWNM